jgi:hypothetical protein
MLLAEVDDRNAKELREHEQRHIERRESGLEGAEAMPFTQ